jgi:4-hydroxybutyrate CoA-transferase
MPRTLGDSFIPVTDIDRFVEVDAPLYELQPAHTSDTERHIADHVAGLIEDGSCLQLGIGGIPDAVLNHLGSLKDLGIHSEMVSDGVKRLVEKGVTTGEQKKLHKGTVVVAFLMGTKNLYQWAHQNQIIEMRTVDYTNNPAVIARNSRAVAINSALEVDLLGQVCADTLGPRQFSGVGGQLNFVRGTLMSEGGKAIIALPSTAKEGVSRILPTLKAGAAVTTSRNDVDYVVTDYGFAALRGKTVRARMKALIEVAHPQFREELARKAREIYGARL